MDWEIDKIHHSLAIFPPKLEKGWEPFAVTPDSSHSVWIWLKRPKKKKKE